MRRTRVGVVRAFASAPPLNAAGFDRVGARALACANAHRPEHLAPANATRAAPMTCSHDGGIKCAVECERAWRDGLRNVVEWTGTVEAEARKTDYAADGAEEATGAMRIALDRMRRWERGEANDDAVDANEDARANVLRDFEPRQVGFDALQQAASFATSSDGWSDHHAGSEPAR